MISGLYLSATGVLINSYRQDVIANNIANAETVGFKRDLALFQERPTQAQETGAPPSETNALLEGLGGGILASPTALDNSQGELEPGGPLDAAVQGNGFFSVNDAAGRRLTRDGRFNVNGAGRLVLTGGGQDVLSDKGTPIQLDPHQTVKLGSHGSIFQGGIEVGRIGLFDVSDRATLQKKGGTLLAYGDSTLQPATGEIYPGFTERANVDPATELTHLMDAQRQLEANANMIRYQDETLNRLVNDVGKVS